MNPIKFRVWHKDFARFLAPEEWFINFNGELFFSDVVGKDSSGLLKCKSEYVIQGFTGQLDSKGKEIFEGDIVRETRKEGPNCRYTGVLSEKDLIPRLQEIKWGNYFDGEYVDAIECWMIGDLDFLSEAIYRTKSNYQEYIFTYEVVGNIFQNPEML